MTSLLRVYRIFALVAWSLFIALLSMPYQIRGGWRSIKRISRITQLWSKGVARIIGLRVTISGNIPETRGGLVVSNHVSYLDIIAHGSVLPLRCSPKTEIAQWPVLGWYVGLNRPIWTDRESRQASQKTLRDFTKTMKRGIFLIVYPEGTSTDGKKGILPFKSTSFEAAITGNAPVIPVITRYKEIRGEPSVSWYGEMTLLPHIWQVLARPRIEARLRFLPPILPNGRSRKEFAAHLHSIMSDAYAKTLIHKVADV